MLVFSSNGHRKKSTPIGRQPTIFVAHSRGGLVVKKAYLLGKYDSQYSDIISKTQGIVFLATPHRGAHNAKMLNNILSTTSFGAPPKAYIEDLEIHSRMLQDINEQFRTQCGELPLVSFFETMKTNFRVETVHDCRERIKRPWIRSRDIDSIERRPPQHLQVQEQGRCELHNCEKRPQAVGVKIGASTSST